MRSLELVLSIVNMAGIAVMIFPRLRAAAWSRTVAPLAAATAVAQIAIEGIRWQMVPAYLVSGILLLFWIVGSPRRSRKRSGIVPAAAPFGAAMAAKVALAVLGAFAVVLSIALPAILPVFRFPRPDGPYAIGTLTFHWEDASRPELFAADPHARRELMAQIWYPARGRQSGRHAPYMDDAAKLLVPLARMLHLPPFIFSHFRYVTTNAIEGATVADDEKKYPALIYLSGLYGFRSASMFQIQSLASRGYIVVGLDQPGGAGAVEFPDGREITAPPRALMNRLIERSIGSEKTVPSLFGRAMPEGILPYFAEDVSFVIDMLAALDKGEAGEPFSGRIDLHRIGVFGISLGAMVAGEAAFRDPRIGAVLMMDAAMPVDVTRDGLRRAALWMTRPASSMRLERERSGGWAEKDIAETLSTQREAFRKSDIGYYIEMPGLFHVNFTDAPYWSPLTEQLGFTGPVDAGKTFAAINAYSAAFFDAYLKGAPISALGGLAGEYPEFRVESWRP